MMTFIFQIYYATPIIRLLIRVISVLKVTCNFLSELNEILYSDQSEDGEYNGDNSFSKFLCHALLGNPDNECRWMSIVTTCPIIVKFCTLSIWWMVYTMMTFIFQIYYAPLCRLLIRVIIDLKVTCNYLLDLTKILYSDQLEDGKYKYGIYFSNFLCHAYN